jgi:preprotein translocase subunit SecE
VNEELKVQNAGGADIGRLVIAVALVIAGVAAFYYFDAASAWLRWGAVVAGIALGVGVIATSAYGRAVTRFVLDSRVELRKIVWPSQRDTLRMTLVVFVFVIIGGVFFWLLDLLLGLAVRHLTGQGG